MCFSAGASFTAGILLTFTGTETLKKVHHPTQIAFASIPIFFGFQQFAEGILWLVINKPQFAVLQSVMTTIFLIMAQIVWPILVPLSVLLMEKHSAKKNPDISVGHRSGRILILRVQPDILPRTRGNQFSAYSLYQRLY